MAPLSFQLRPGPGGGPGRSPVAPREWQSRLVQLLRARLLNATSTGQDVLVHAGPGAGKTLGALLGFHRLRGEGRLERLLIFCHRSSIARQWLSTAERLGVDLAEWDPEGAGAGATGLLISYQSAVRHRQRLEHELSHDFGPCRWLAVADEVHHLGLDPDEPEASAWGHAFGRLTTTARLRLGLTGTPFRADQLAFCAARRIRCLENGTVVERIVPDLCVEPRRLILEGDVRPLEFRFQDGWVEHGRPQEGDEREVSPLSAEARESWRARNLRRAIRLGDESGIAQRLLLGARDRLERVRQGHPGAGGLVIARNIEHAGTIGALLREQGDRVLVVHSQDPEAATRLAAFRGGEGDWLVSIDMCAEGFDAPRLRVVAYLTTVVTRSRFVQAITRAVRMDGERSAREPIPRHASYVFAPADPLLIDFARHWSLSAPYRIRPPAPPAGVAGGPGGGSSSIPLQALADGAGSLLHVSGPQLPEFLRRAGA